MIAALEHLNLTDAAILLGVVLYALTKLADLRGWTRSPALVRQENADLRERNATLEMEVKRLDASDRSKGERIAALEAQVDELKQRDQAAVLTALKDHEVEAKARHAETIVRTDRLYDVLVEIRDTLKEATP